MQHEENHTSFQEKKRFSLAHALVLLCLNCYGAESQVNDASPTSSCHQLVFVPKDSLRIFKQTAILIFDLFIEQGCGKKNHSENHVQFNIRVVLMFIFKDAFPNSVCGPAISV